ncbi:nucleolar protein 6-like protein [Leptotrombidium deliense]|uniref:Nucleolar protein 6 n=1 Tax=Leptotrombidium deliense TaxID=299467 RepID=A0A443SLB6_9ACAR|nr:nucleolar protein 6-like protein [Leptotrombidium deliense]
MKSEKRNLILQFTEQVKHCLQNIEGDNKTEVSFEYFENKKNVNVPFTPRGETKTSFVFRRPNDVQIIGSFLTNTFVKKDLTIDLLVTIPKKCFHERDYLNQKYFEKCALYIAFIALNLKKTFGKLISLQYAYFNGIHLKPVLLLNNSNLNYCSFRILVVGESCCFKQNRFLPTTSNVRYNWFYGKDGEEVLTPYYNSLILQDLNLLANNEYLVNNIEENEELREVIVALKVWLRQRGYTKSHANFLTMFTFYLINEKKITTSSLDDTGISLCTAQPVPITTFSEVYDVVFLDSSGYFNLSFDIPSHVYKSLKHEANLTVKFLDKSSPNLFESFLMKPVPFNEKFDAIVLINNRAFSDGVVSQMEIEDRFLDSGGDIIKTCVPSIINMINYGWSHRFLLSQEEYSSTTLCWNINECPPSTSDSNFTKLGFLFNAEHIFEAIDRGPTADKPEAEDFKLYWEELSELRRFQDGEVCEAVYWKASNINEKRHIFRTALRHILQKKARISPHRLSFPGCNIENVLHLNHVNLPKNEVYATGEEALQNVLTNYDSLCKKLRNLQELPLDISRIQGISAIFRGSEVFPPLNGHLKLGKDALKVLRYSYSFVEENDKVPLLMDPLEVILHFETTGKWPNDLGAIRRLKAAIHIELSKQLKQKFGISSKLEPQFVDVYYQGYIFRLIVSCYKEILLMRSMKNDDGVLCKIESKEADELEIQIDILPKLTSALYSVHLKYATFGTACRLAKRWLASQMFTDYLNDITVELIMAYIYIDPFPYSVPNSPFVAFIRFISLIATFDWKQNALIVNVNDEFSKEKMEEIETKFTSERSTWPPMSIISPYDKHSSMWTADSPSLPILKRLITVAKMSKSVLNEQFNLRGADQLIIFRPPVDVFDVIIHLKTKVIPNFHMRMEHSEKKLIRLRHFDGVAKKVIMPIIDFNPVQKYLEQLRKGYEEIALFFYDKFGGDIIGVVFKPVAFETRSDDAFCNFCKLAEVSSNDGLSRYEVNFEAIVEDFSILGENIVDRVEIKNKQWIEN